LAGEAACTFSHNDRLIWRPGFKIWHEDWSAANIADAADLGARYFVSNYGFGLSESARLLDELAETYRVVERNESWVIIDLVHPPAASTAAPSRL
jgi:hypothetical protein